MHLCGIGSDFVAVLHSIQSLHCCNHSAIRSSHFYWCLHSGDGWRRYGLMYFAHSSTCGSRKGQLSDATCTSASAAVPRLHSLQLAAPRLHPLQLLLLKYVCLLSCPRSTKYNRPTHTLQISSLCMLLHISLICWVGIPLSNK